MTALRFASIVAMMAVPLLAGCVQVPDLPPPPVEVPPPFVPLVTILPENVMTFRDSVVSVAQGTVNDLYEPTMEVSDTGAIYVAGHVIGVATTGTPAYVSNDDGQTWRQLPLAGPLAAPPPLQGSTPPPGDEGFIVAGADGQAWMADIYAAGFTVNGWCDDGGSLCYDNRYAYDRAQSSSTSCTAPADPEGSTAGSLNDRPWAAYGNGSLLLVNNPGGGPMQLGVMQVPPLTPVGLFDPVTGPKWNLCASPGGFIPGIPAMRGDGFFAVPQYTPVDAGAGQKRTMTVVVGNASNIMDVQVRDAFEFSSTYGGTINVGNTAFGRDGTLFVGAYNNTGKFRTPLDEVQGRFILAASTDDGRTFVNVTFVTGTPVRSLYLDSNTNGPGALLTWSQLGDDEGTSDWYVAHVHAGLYGEPVLRNVTLAVDEGPHSSAHVMGAAAGPDGRAYFVLYDDTDTIGYVGSTPLRVVIQETGPTLPVDVAATQAA